MTQQLANNLAGCNYSTLKAFFHSPFGNKTGVSTLIQGAELTAVICNYFLASLPAFVFETKAAGDDWEITACCNSPVVSKH